MARMLRRVRPRISRLEGMDATSLKRAWTVASQFSIMRTPSRLPKRSLRGLIMSRLPSCLVVALLLASSIPAARAQASLDKLLEPYLARYELPALAAAVVVDGKIVASGAVGTRRVGTNT